MKMLTTSPSYTQDWLTRKLPHWQRHLSHLAGKPIQGIEIGSFEGRSACWLLDNIFTNAESQLTCIDPWTNRDVEERFDKNVGPYSNLRKIKARSHEVLRCFSHDSYDFIYVDGDHSTLGVLEDAVLSFRLLNIGGVMIFDDYLWKNPNKWPCVGLPQPAIDVFLSIYCHHIEVLHKSYQVIVRRVS